MKLLANKKFLAIVSTAVGVAIGTAAVLFANKKLDKTSVTIEAE